MIATLCSDSERLYCRQGVAQGIRNDGRAPCEYRPVTIDVGVLPQTNGSARVTIGKNSATPTDVIAAVKAEARFMNAC